MRCVTYAPGLTELECIVISPLAEMTIGIAAAYNMRVVVAVIVTCGREMRGGPGRNVLPLTSRPFRQIALWRAFGHTLARKLRRKFVGVRARRFELSPPPTFTFQVRGTRKYIFLPN